MYELPGSEHCPVKMYNAYKSKRPAGVEIHGKRLNNTSVRNHLCQKLMDNNIPDNHAIHITGQKNPGSLNN